MLNERTYWSLIACFFALTITFLVLFLTAPATTATAANLNTNLSARSSGADSFRMLTASNPFDKIDRIYYINMDARTDRKYQIEQELKNMNVPWAKVQRVSGVVAAVGALGCSKAHLNALKDCQDHGYANCLILEDDFMFKSGRETVYAQFEKFWQLNLAWDMVLLSSNTIRFETTYLDFLIRLKEAQTTAGYLVNSAFLPALLDNVSRGIELLEQNTSQGDYCIDQYWKRLQEQSNWYTFTPVLAHQRDGYSDIEKRNVSYDDKREVAQNSTRPVDYIISVLSCVPRLKKSTKQTDALNLLLKNHNIQYFYYYGDPTVSQDFRVNLTASLVCVRDRDDYLNLSHKIGQMIHFLTNYVRVNQSCSHVKGFLFIDDDLDMFPTAFWNFLEARQTIAYWGNTATHTSLFSDHLKAKNEQSTVIHKTLLSYPELLEYPIKVRNGVTYCSGGCFYVRADTLYDLANLTYAFTPFPETAEELNFHKKTDLASGQVYFDELCVFDDLDIGAALKDIGITAVHAPIKEIVHWEGL